MCEDKEFSVEVNDPEDAYHVLIKERNSNKRTAIYEVVLLICEYNL
jgi:hypothetical protein